MLAKKISVSKEYADFSNVFSKQLTAMLAEHLDINEHVINLVPGKQPPYKPIYSLSLISS